MIKVEGGAQLREVALRLRAAGQIELKKSMYRNLRLATEPVRKAIQDNERAVLPKSGGLNEWVASTKVGHRTLIGPKTAGVTIVQSKKGRAKPHDLRRLNEEGVIRHPVYAVPGKKRTWVTQTGLPTHFWDAPILASRPAVTAYCLRTVHETSLVAGFKP